jgi:hypothetical protein
MTDIAAAVASALGKIIDSGKIEAAIDTTLEHTITHAINEELGHYSAFSKELREKVKAAVGIKLGDLKIGEYNAVVIDIINRKLGPMIAEFGAKQIEADLAKLLAPAPAEKWLSALVEDFKADLTTYYAAREDRHETITVRTHLDGTFVKHWTVDLDRKPNQQPYACEFRFMVNDRGEMFALRFGGRNTEKDVFIGGYYGFERTLFQLHACKTKLIMDVDAVDRSITWGECTCD